MNNNELIIQLKNGDLQSLKVVFELYYTSMFKAAYFVSKDAALAEDAVQEVFILLVEKIHQLNDSSRLEAWLTRIAVNKARDMIRKRAKEVTLTGYEKVEEKNDGPLPSYLKKEEIKLVQEAIKSLPEDVQYIFFLRYEREMSVKDISQHAGIPEGTVKSKLHRGREAVRRFLEREGNFKRHNGKAKNYASREVKQ